MADAIGILRKPVPLHRQPSGSSGPNMGFSAIKQMVAAWDFRGSGFVDVVHGLKGTLAIFAASGGVNPAPSVGPYGNAWEFDGTGSMIEFGTVLGSSPISTATGVVTQFRQETVGDQDMRIIDLSDGGGGAHGWYCETEDDGSDNTPFAIFGYRDTSNVRAHLVADNIDTSVWTRGGWNTLCISIGKNSEASGHIHGYLNGKNLRDVANIATDGAARADTAIDDLNMRIAAWQTAADRQWNGDIAMIALFTGLLPEALVKSLSINPWQVFAPRLSLVGTGIAPAAGGEEFLGRQYPQGVMRGAMRGVT